MFRFSRQLELRVLVFAALCLLAPSFVAAHPQSDSAADSQALLSSSDQTTQAQTSSPNSSSNPQETAPQAGAPADSDSSDPLTLFPHSETSRYWISGQANIILQWHPAFHAPYSGPNSLRPVGENGTS